MTKTQAAFVQRWPNRIGDSCSRCGSTAWAGTSIEQPPLDRELLDEWGSDPGLSFLDQDEEIVLADPSNLELLVEAIDHERYLSAKTRILVEALCVMLYDHSYPSDEFSPDELRQRSVFADRMRPLLRARSHMLQKTGAFVMDYVAEVVFPQIGIALESK